MRRRRQIASAIFGAVVTVVGLPVFVNEATAERPAWWVWPVVACLGAIGVYYTVREVVRPASRPGDLRRAILRARVDEGSMLDAILRRGQALGVSAANAEVAVVSRRTRSRGRRRFANVVDDWHRATEGVNTGAVERSRLVIIGEPGFGKTVAALRIVATVNGRSSRAEHDDAPVAELFSLADWYRWAIRQSGSRFTDWLGEELASTYSGLSVERAVELVEEGRVLPILDGLDEVPAGFFRRSCVDAVNSYARRAGRHRPFVVTCRAKEYRSLGADVIFTDEEVELLGIEDEEVRRVVERRAAVQPAWQALRHRLDRRDARLLAVLRSPLRLSIALEVYDTAPPDELLGMTPEAAEQRLWERLLHQQASAYPESSPEEVISWLVVLARGMKRADRQRFKLHELYLFAPSPSEEVSRFRRSLGLLCAAGVGASVALVLGTLAVVVRGAEALLVPSRFAMLVALAILTGLLVTASVTLADESDLEFPSVPAPGSRRADLRRKLKALPITGTIGAAAGLISGLITWWTVGHWYANPLARGAGWTLGITCALVAIDQAMTLVERKELVANTFAEEPALDAAGPTTLLRASLRHSCGVFVTSFATAGLPFTVGLGSAVGYSYGLVGGVCAGLVWATYRWLTDVSHAWLFYRWLRYRLRSLQLLPPDPLHFLTWCAAPERAWLRVSESIEFRHGSLRDHLAPGELTTAPHLRPVPQRMIREFQQYWTHMARWARRSFCVYPSIPSRIAATARSSSNLPESEVILAVLDCSLLGRGSFNLTFGCDAVYFHTKSGKVDMIDYPTFRGLDVVSTGDEVVWLGPKVDVDVSDSFLLGEFVLYVCQNVQRILREHEEESSTPSG